MDTFKIINVNTAAVIETGLDFYEARHKIESQDDLCMMRDDQDVADSLQRRAAMIAAWGEEA
jgi:hypothetical protein